jgi:nicotinamide-nucleotide amidase
MFDTDRVKKIKDIMVERKQTIAVAESVTAGFLQAAIASAPEAIYFFQGGITAYNLGQKTRHLDVDPIHATECNCVSEKMAEDMALSSCDLFLSHWGIGITGYATAVPESGNEVYAYFSICYDGEVMITRRLDSSEKDAQKVQMYYVEEVIKALLGLLEEEGKKRVPGVKRV